MSRHDAYIVVAILLVVAAVCSHAVTFYSGAAFGAGVTLACVGVIEALSRRPGAFDQRSDWHDMTSANEESPRWSAWEAGQPRERFAKNPGCGHLECDGFEQCWRRLNA